MILSFDLYLGKFTRYYKDLSSNLFIFFAWKLPCLFKTWFHTRRMMSQHQMLEIYCLTNYYLIKLKIPNWIASDYWFIVLYVCNSASADTPTWINLQPGGHPPFLFVYFLLNYKCLKYCTQVRTDWRPYPILDYINERPSRAETSLPHILTPCGLHQLDR